MKLLFIQGSSTTARLLFFVLLSIGLMTVDHRHRHVEALRTSLSVVVYPLQVLVHLPVAIGDWAMETLATRTQLIEDNSQLRTQNLLLKAQLQTLTSLETENQRLRELLQSSKRLGERVLIADLLAVDVDPYTRQIVINKGTRHGVFLGQPLLDAAGIMGQIVHANPFSANAMLITDPAHALPVQVNRNGLRAIAVGTGASNKLELPHIPNNADILVGDLLVTSGLGGHFPPGYPVGVVSEVRQDPGLPFAQVFAEPSAILERSREVLLVWLNDDGDAHDAPAQEVRAQ